jgi:hypothetical protein
MTIFLIEEGGCLSGGVWCVVICLELVCVILRLRTKDDDSRKQL